MTQPKRISRLEDITPDRHNANKGTARGLALLDDSLRRLGAGRSIVVDANGESIAGAKTLERAVEIGLRVRVVQTQGDELVVVQRTDLDLSSDTDTRARELAYADNRVAQLDLEWDTAQLAADADAGINLDAVGFREQELVHLLNVETDVDSTPATDEPASSDTVRETFAVLISCASELDQTALLDRLTSEGLTCRALVS